MCVCVYIYIFIYLLEEVPVFGGHANTLFFYHCCLLNPLISRLKLDHHLYVDDTHVYIPLAVTRHIFLFHSCADVSVISLALSDK